MPSGTRLMILGVDGLDYDVVLRIGEKLLPNLHAMIFGSSPHSAVFPPDSVPSWTTIVTGQPPELHGQIKNANFLLEGSKARSGASLQPDKDQCFWDRLPNRDIAVVNPFLAFPPWSPSNSGAMVSGPSFSEGPPMVCDPRSLFSGETPPRMGGFAGIPTQRDLEDFVVATMNVAESQFLYSLHQLEHRKWDLFFHTNLTVDRIQHYAWRHFDENDPTYAGNKLSQLIPLAHQQVDRFLGSVRALLDPEDQLVVLSDHGHGQRSSIGVNLAEIFRRQGLLVFDRTSRVKRVIERTKTSVISAAYACHIEEPMTWVARRLPGKQSLKSGAFAGDQNNSMVTIPDVGGSNPFGGIQVGDPALIDDVLSVVNELEHNGKKVFRWCLPAEEILSTKSNPFEFYPTLLFELEPSFGPTWNMFGREFTPIMTHKIQSGGHTRRAVFCSTDASIIPPTDSLDVNRALIQLMDKYV